MRAGKEIIWVLEGRTPDQIPLARLAEYMQQLAILLGQMADVHLSRVEEGSTRIVTSLPSGGPAQRAQARVYAVRDRRAPADAMRAFSRINAMVAEDRGPARITFGSAIVLRFPGAAKEPFRVVTMRDHAVITGRLYALIEESSGQVKARIRPRSRETYVACTADEVIGRRLRNFFQDIVRVEGVGEWARSENGEWQCTALKIKDVQAVRDLSLRDAIDKVRAIEADWPEDPLADWDAEEKGDAA